MIIIGSILFTSLTFFSGWTTQQGLQFISVNIIDGIIHLAYIKNLTFAFPPDAMSLAGYSLHGYHYFYDFLLSRFVVLYHFSPEDLQFRLFPLFLSLLYGGGFYLFAQLFTANSIAKRCILFFAYFGQSFAFLYLPAPNKFGLDIGQPMGLILDPSIILSLPIFLSGIFLLVKANKTITQAIIIGLLLGMLCQIKIYVGLVAIGTLLIYCGYTFFTKRISLKFILATLSVTLFLTAITYLPNNFGTGGLVWAPLVFYDHYLRQSAFDQLHWGQRFDIFVQHHNLPRIILMYTQALFIFFTINLGLRSVTLLSLPKLWEKTFWLREQNILLFSILLLPILIASFFIQTFSTFNSVQFIWIFLMVMSIPAGMQFSAFLLSSRRMIKYTAFVILIVGSIYGITNMEAQYVFAAKPLTYSPADVALLQKASNLVPNQSFIIVIPKALEWPSQPVVSGLTGKVTYVENELHNEDLYPRVTQKRKEQIKLLHQAFADCRTADFKRLLKQIGSSYVISSNNYPCLIHNFSITQQFSATDFYFYKFSE